MNDLPGTPFNVSIRCPACGWGFDFGLRKIAEIEDGTDDNRAFTCCSKCLSNIVFNLDGTHVEVITPEMLATFSPAAQTTIHAGQFVAWLSQRTSRGPLQ